MAQENFFNRFTAIYTDKSINGWVRGIAWLGTGVVLYVVGSTVYKAVKDAQSAANAAAEQDKRVSEIEAEINKAQNPTDPNKLPQQPTFEPSQYGSFANTIASAFSGCDWTSGGGYIPIVWQFSDSGSTVWNVANQLQNDVDFLRLQEAFGVKTITKGWQCGGDYKNVDLHSAITLQLNQKEINYINDTLASKGIKYKF